MGINHFGCTLPHGPAQVRTFATLEITRGGLPRDVQPNWALETGRRTWAALVGLPILAPVSCAFRAQYRVQFRAMAGRSHQVEIGDCMASIADRYGFFWKTLWELPENASLKNQRQNPNVLLPGDQVVIPDKRIVEKEAAADARHTFVRLGVPLQFRVRLLSGGRPRANVDYSCVIDGGSIEGQTDSDGMVKLSITPGVRSATLLVREAGTLEQYDLLFGDLNPIDDMSGVQQRLNNLGYDCQMTGQLDEQTKMALSSFRADNKLPDSDTIDDTTKNALRDAHGS
jgi:hypothetical protein